MIDYRLPLNPQIPEELQEVYSRLAGMAFNVLRALGELETLFGASKEAKEAIDLMNQTAPEFFMHHQELLSNHVILSISRLTDKKRSGPGKNQENLTLACLLDLEPTKYPELHADLCKRWEVIQADAKPVRQFRNKVLAHASQEHCLSPSAELVDGITLKSVKDLLNQINDYLATFECPFTGVDASLQCPATVGGAEDLLEYLKLGVDAKEKQHEEARGLTGRV